MRRRNGLLALLFFFGCAKVISVERIPDIALGEPTFFPTIEAHTGATIAGGNRVEILFNGDETFPVMLRDIKAAKSTITFAQYLYEGGSLAREFAQAFAERCRAGEDKYSVRQSWLRQYPRRNHYVDARCWM